MDPDSESPVTRLLERWVEGDEAAGDELAPLVYEELKLLALGHMARRPGERTLQPTALVNEAWMRLMRAQGASFQSRNHFYALAARVMRSVLLDHARRKGSEKRGGHLGRVSVDLQAKAPTEHRALDILHVNDALERLTEMDAELGRLVELRFFGGLDMESAAAALGLSKRTAERRWTVASAWLQEELGES